MTSTNPSASTADLRRLMDAELSQASRLGYVALLLGSLTMTVVVSSLWLTEPVLPTRTRIAFALMIVIGLSWTAFAVSGTDHSPRTVWSGQRGGWALGGHLHDDVRRRGCHAGLHERRNGAVCRGRHGSGAPRWRSRAAGPGAATGGPLDNATRSAHARDGKESSITRNILSVRDTRRCDAVPGTQLPRQHGLSDDQLSRPAVDGGERRAFAGAAGGALGRCRRRQ